MAITYRPAVASSAPTPLGMDIFTMPFSLIVEVAGFTGLFEEEVKRLDLHLTEFFFQSPILFNGLMTISVDIYGDIGQQAKRMHTFFYALKQIFPGLTWSFRFGYGR